MHIIVSQVRLKWIDKNGVVPGKLREKKKFSYALLVFPDYNWYVLRPAISVDIEGRMNRCDNNSIEDKMFAWGR
jgi:hypothetical protein